MSTSVMTDLLPFSVVLKNNNNLNNHNYPSLHNNHYQKKCFTYLSNLAFWKVHPFILFLVKRLLEFTNCNMQINQSQASAQPRVKESSLLNTNFIIRALVFVLSSFCFFRTGGQLCTASSLKLKDVNKSSKSFHVSSLHINAMAITGGSCKDSYR